MPYCNIQSLALLLRVRRTLGVEGLLYSELFLLSEMCLPSSLTSSVLLGIYNYLHIFKVGWQLTVYVILDI